MDKDIFAERGRSLEEDYFRKKDRELVEKMRQAAAAEQARTAMGQKVGITDPALLAELESLGFTPETVTLLPLVPVVQVAWAEGGVSAAERALIVKLARSRGITDGSAADRTLTSWLASNPGEAVFAKATRLIRAMLDSPDHGDLTADDVVKQAEAIAAASGGILGMNKISAEERQLLASLAEQLKKR
jgi:tellurite resistance protein